MRDMELPALVKALRKDGPVCLLDSQMKEHPDYNYTLLGGRPASWIKVEGKTTTIWDGEKQFSCDDISPWDALKQYQKRNKWMMGWIGYDMKNATEDLETKAADPQGFPDSFFFEPGFLLRINHQTNSLVLLAGEMPALEKYTVGEPPVISDLTSNKNKEQYLNDIKAAKRLIVEGECYEINVSRQLSGSFRGESLDLYLAMKAAGPVPFGAYLFAEGRHICSASPERFLKKEGRHIISQPIKGTLGRIADAGEDLELVRNQLLTEKNKAENLMIVDLVRHDFSKIAETNSVHVDQLFEVQSFETVHQLVSTISARLKPDVEPVDAIKACFPMGSMTGAPKISAMQHIEEIEKYKRGVYSGTIGYITPEGDFDFNVVIRTALINGETMSYGVGGAITIDSNPEEEWEETNIKSKALLHAIQRESLG